MDELLELKSLLLRGDIAGCLAIVDELEEMSRDDKISNIGSYAVILLLHLIKQNAEKRSTKSWEVSIRNSVRQIQRKNKRRKSGGFYLSGDELGRVLEEAYPDAIDAASLEVEGGRFAVEELENIVDKEEVLRVALGLILSED